jgi:uncharacterized protein YjbI with pentapeptide repeats
MAAPPPDDDWRKRKPTSWKQRHKSIEVGWKVPFIFAEWLTETIVFWLKRWALIDLIKILGGLSVVVAAWQYITGADERTTARHYQAWQVINLAHGKGGSGGRIEALQELVRDGVDLSGVDLAGAWLQRIAIPGARFVYGKVDSADLRLANLANAVFGEVTGVRANFAGANLRRARFSEGNFREVFMESATLCWASFDGVDLEKASLAESNVMGLTMVYVDLRGANLAAMHNWNTIGQMVLTNIYGVRRAPPGFERFAIDSLGAVSIASRADWQRLIIDSARAYGRRFRPRYDVMYDYYFEAHDEKCLDVEALQDSPQLWMPFDSEPQFVPDTTQVLPRYVPDTTPALPRIRQ